MPAGSSFAMVNHGLSLRLSSAWTPEPLTSLTQHSAKRFPMPYKMNEQQLNAVLALNNEERYQHFVSKVADWEQLWGVRTNDGWLVPATPEGVEYFPLWPHPEYAQRVADKNWPGHKAEELNYAFLVSEGLEKLANDNVKVAVFPDMAWQCILTDARQLLCDLLSEAEKYD